MRSRTPLTCLEVHRRGRQTELGSRSTAARRFASTPSESTKRIHAHPGNPRQERGPHLVARRHTNRLRHELASQERFPLQDLRYPPQRHAKATLAAIPSEYMQWSPDGRRIIFNRYRSTAHPWGSSSHQIQLAARDPPPASDQPIQRQAGAFGRFVVAGWNGHCRLRGSRRVSQSVHNLHRELRRHGSHVRHPGKRRDLEPSGVTTSSGPPRIVTRALRGSDSAVTWGAYIPIS